MPDVPQPCHALVDLYGQCEQVSGYRDEVRGVLGYWEASGPQRGSGDLSSCGLLSSIGDNCEP